MCALRLTHPKCSIYCCVFFFYWTRPGQDFYFALIQSTSKAFRKQEPMSYTSIGLHTQTKPNPRYFRQYRNPSKDTSSKNGTYKHPIQQHIPYYRRRYTASHTPDSTWVQIKLSEVVRALVYMSKGVFRSLKSSARLLIRQTCFPAVRALLTSDYK